MKLVVFLVAQCVLAGIVLAMEDLVCLKNHSVLETSGDAVLSGEFGALVWSKDGCSLWRVAIECIDEEGIIYFLIGCKAENWGFSSQVILFLYIQVC